MPLFRVTLLSLGGTVVPVEVGFFGLLWCQQFTSFLNGKSESQSQWTMGPQLHGVISVEAHRIAVWPTRSSVNSSERGAGTESIYDNGLTPERLKASSSSLEKASNIGNE